MRRDMPSALPWDEVSQGDEIFKLKTRWVLADMLLEIDPEKCQDFAIGEGHDKVPHVLVTKSPCFKLVGSTSCRNFF